ncbi:unnamed protein product [Auanema sp. JU1783]|nr:unnamed protein product [Auanema sp. JU1783]
MVSESILDDRIDASELEKFRDNYLAECARGNPSTDIIFAYASALVRSNKKTIREGVRILKYLIENESRESYQRDYIYYLSLGYAHLNDYDRALAYIDILLKSEEENHQAVNLKKIIKKKMHKHGFIGVAIFGAFSAVVAGAAIGIVKAVKS